MERPRPTACPRRIHSTPMAYLSRSRGVPMAQLWHSMAYPWRAHPWHDCPRDALGVGWFIFTAARLCPRYDSLGVASSSQRYVYVRDLLGWARYPSQRYAYFRYDCVIVAANVCCSDEASKAYSLHLARRQVHSIFVAYSVWQEGGTKHAIRREWF